mmetsp:Transcript_50891/g.149983  ORF Transcript_50891/g.149983 Transcript_50891/m.149983 type:complete len:289 (-) Transcript_50891:132-998(-)
MTSSGTKYSGGLVAFGMSSSGGSCFGSKGADPAPARRGLLAALASTPPGPGTSPGGGTRLLYRSLPRDLKMPIWADLRPEAAAWALSAGADSASVAVAPSRPRPRPLPRGLPRPAFSAAAPDAPPPHDLAWPEASWRALNAHRRSPPHSTEMAAVPAATGSMPSASAAASSAFCTKVLATASKWIIVTAAGLTSCRSLVTARWSSRASLKHSTARCTAPPFSVARNRSRKRSRRATASSLLLLLPPPPGASTSVKGKSRTSVTRGLGARRSSACSGAPSDSRALYRSV